MAAFESPLHSKRGSQHGEAEENVNRRHMVKVVCSDAPVGVLGVMEAEV
jgi:hypothetical protein